MELAALVLFSVVSGWASGFMGGLSKELVVLYIERRRGRRLGPRKDNLEEAVLAAGWSTFTIGDETVYVPPRRR